MAGASKQASSLQKQTPVNPSVMSAAGLIIITSDSNSTTPTLFGISNNMKKRMTNEADLTKKAIMLFKELSPKVGTYVNETDYFEPNWQQAFWGRHYSRLLMTKNKYDPKGLFYCHHCVGSENWGQLGMKRIL